MSVDVESGESSIISPMMHDDENPQLRWSFIRKVYSIITFQLLLTVVVVSVVVFVRPVANFFNNNIHDNVFFKVTFFAFCLLCYYHQKHSLGYFFLLFLTVSVALSIGLSCALVGGALPGGKIIILEVATLTTIVVISLSLYTFCANKRGRNFIYLGPFLFGALPVLSLIGLVQILFFPFEKLSAMIYGCLIFVIVFGCIVCTIDNLTKWFSYAEYMLVSASLYLCVISIFLYLLFIFCVVELIKK